MKLALAAALIAVVLAASHCAQAQTNFQTPGGGRVPGVVIMCYAMAPGQGPDGAPEAIPCPDTVLKSTAGMPLGEGNTVPGQFSPPIVTVPGTFLCGTAALLGKWNTQKGCFDP
jgi:hypothetical protein